MTPVVVRRYGAAGYGGPPPRVETGINRYGAGPAVAQSDWLPTARKVEVAMANQGGKPLTAVPR